MSPQNECNFNIQAGEKKRVMFIDTIDQGIA